MVSILMGHYQSLGARCSFVVRAFAFGAMGRRINPLCCITVNKMC